MCSIITHLICQRIGYSKYTSLIEAVETNEKCTSLKHEQLYMLADRLKSIKKKESIDNESNSD